MKKITGSLFTALTLLALAAPAAAQDMAPDTTFDFRDELVTGDLVRPEGDRIEGRLRGVRVSLIRPRPHYVPELLKSVETL